MARIASLWYGLRVDSKQLKRGLRAAERDWRRHRRAVTRQVSEMSRTVAVAATAGGAALAAMTAKALQGADRIAKGARDASLAAGEYQTLAHVFELAGSSGDKLTRGIQAMQRNLLQLRFQSKTSVDTFALLGLTLRDLDPLTPGQQFRLLLRRIAELHDPTLRAAIAQQLLGRAGKELATVLGSSAEALLRQEGRLRSLGGVLETDVLRRVEHFNDEMTVLRRVAMAQFTRGMADAAGESRDFSEVIEDVGSVARKLGELLPRLTHHLLTHRETIALVAKAYIAWRTALIAHSIVTLLGSIGRAVVSLTRLISLMTVAKFKALISTALWTTALGALGVGLIVVFNAITKLVDGAETNVFEALAEGFKKMLRDMEGFFSGVLDTARSSMQELRDLLDVGTLPKLPVYLGHAGGGTPGRADGSAGGPGQPPAPVDVRFPADATASRLQESIERFSQDVGQRMASALRAGDWSGVGDALVAALANHFTNNLAQSLADIIGSFLEGAFAKLPSFLGSIFSGSFGGFGDLGGFGGIASFLGFREGGIVPGLPGRPRLVVAHAGEAILNEAQQRRVFAGTTVHMSNTLVGDVTRATRDAIRRDARLIGEIATERQRTTGALTS